jgi:hypothetical protein
VTRRRFLGAAAGVTGAALLADWWLPAVAQAQTSGGATPLPIPGGDPAVAPFHVYFVGKGALPGTITNFNGYVGAQIIDGTGTWTDASGATTKLLFDVDNRFMKGLYTGTDGQTHAGTFGFI